MPCAFHAQRPWPFHDLNSGCQFPDDPAHPPVEFDDNSWCRFHLPPEALDAAGVRKADWDDDAIEAFNAAVFNFIDAAKAAGNPADLSGVMFPGNIAFGQYDSKADALPPIVFYKARFGGMTWFEWVHFGGNAEFGNARFDRVVRFGNAHFGSNAGFEKVYFGGDAEFGEACFDHVAWFGEAHFGGFAGFSAAHFDSNAGFTAAYFGRVASFDGTHFSKAAWFQTAHFDSNVQFPETHFGGAADFSGATAEGRREVVELDSQPGRDGMTVTTDAAAVPARPARNDFRGVMFSGARFDGPAIFNNRRFTDTTRFVGVVFEQAPRFHNAVLHQDTDFTGSRFLDKSGDAAPAYRTLKLAMERVRSRDEEGMFHALEMESRRHRADTPRSVKLFSWFYAVGSGYGRSLLRPLGLLGAVTLFFYLVYFGLYAWLGTDGWLEHFIEPLKFTIEQIVRPFAPLMADYPRTPATTDYGRWTQELLRGAPCVWVPAMAQSVASLGLVALFLLALRRRFRIA